MSTLTVTAERLVIHPHPNADALELAQVGLYRAVVARGRYRTGDIAVYIPEGAVLPAALCDELGLTGKLAGPEHNRVKAVRLRGELSQGIVCSPAALSAYEMGVDYAELLGVTKWTPPVPVHMSGDILSAPDLLPWVEIENIKRYPALFEAGEPVVATEKIHGTACLMTWINGEMFVSSKGFGKQRFAIKRAESNLYWRAIIAYDVAELAAVVAKEFSMDRVGVFGEVYGAGVQDLSYGVDATRKPGYAVFDIFAGDRWLDQATVRRVVADLVPMVPTIYEGPYDASVLIGLASGATVLGEGANIREGLVIRPVSERYSEVTGGRAIGKFVSDGYLTRKGGTEYE